MTKAFDLYEFHGIKVPYEELFDKEDRYYNIHKMVFDTAVNAVRTGIERRKWSKETICKNLYIRPEVYEWYKLYLDDVEPEYY